MKKYLFLLLTWAFFGVAASMARTNQTDLNLNGNWEYGIGRQYDGTATVPGVPDDADKPAEGRVWYRKQIDLPEGGWNMAVLELKGARFRPEVYIDGDLVSSQEGGMIRSMHELRHGNLKPGGSISMEISLASLKDVPAADASFIPKVDQWRSNCSSSLWDDVILHLYKDARVDRVLVDCNPAADSVTLRYRVCGTGSATARITVRDGEKGLLTLTDSAAPGENEISFCYNGILEEWSPETPALYTLHDGVWEGGSVSMFSPVLKFTLYERFSEEALEVTETMEMNGKRTFGFDVPIVYRRKETPDREDPEGKC